jgi:uncharacterized membrane protein
MSSDPPNEPVLSSPEPTPSPVEPPANTADSESVVSPPESTSEDVNPSDVAPPLGSGTASTESLETGGASSDLTDARADSLSDYGRLTASTWRALMVSVFTAMGIVTWGRLSYQSSFRDAFLERNEIDPHLRLTFLIAMLGAGAAAGLIVLFLTLYRGEKSKVGAARFAEMVEGWAWFFSPLMLLPAIPVFRSHEIWLNHHKVLLPIVLFFGLLVELLVAQSLRNIPEAVKRLFAPLREEVLTLPARVRKHWFLSLTLLAASAYAVFMAICAVRWHQMFGTATFDLGINNNLLYGGLYGKFNQSTVIFPDDPQKYIANHVKLGLYLFLPVYAIWPRPETIMAVQSVVLGLGAVPLFLFARRRLPEWMALIFALSYLCYYPMHGANFTEGNLVPVAAPFILALVWALDAKRFKTAWVLYFFCIIMREDIPLPLAVLGLFLSASGFRPKSGLFIFTVSTFWFVILRFKIMTDAGSWWFPNMYEDLWAAPYKGFGAVLHTLVTNPMFVLKKIFTEKKFWYILHLMTPLVFLPARRWYLWAAFIPGAIITLLVTSYDPPLMFSFQYVMHWCPYLFMAGVLAVEAMGRDERLIRGVAFPKQAGATLAVGLVSLATTYNYGAFPMRDGYLAAGYHKIRFQFTDADAEKLAHMKAVQAIIPKEARVATTERLGAHLSSRLGFYTLRRGHHDVDYIVAEKSGLKLDRTRQSIYEGLSSGDYGVEARHGPFIVFKRGADTSQNEEVIREWSLKAGRPKPVKKPDPEEDARGDSMPEDAEPDGGSQGERDAGLP